MKKQLIEIFITYRNDYIKNTTTVKLIFGKYFFIAPDWIVRPYFSMGTRGNKKKRAKTLPYFCVYCFLALFSGRIAEFMGM